MKRTLAAHVLAVASFASVAAPLGCGGEAAPPPQTPTDTAAKTSAPSPKTTAIEVPASIRAAVDAPDRDADDKKLDLGRKPAELLAFFGIKPGMKVADIGAAGGYTSELLARAVGESGVVYGQNSQWVIDRFAKAPWSARLAKPVNKNIVSVVRDMDDPVPPEAKDLDAVVLVLLYHDLFWLKGAGADGNVDRAKMNGAVFKALKPGGVYGIVDHSGRAGTGTTEVQSIHRIEEKVVREEIEKAGFKLAAEGDFLRNPSDPRDWNAAPYAAAEKRGTSDRFVLKFVKP